MESQRKAEVKVHVWRYRACLIVVEAGGLCWEGENDFDFYVGSSGDPVPKRRSDLAAVFFWNDQNEEQSMRLINEFAEEHGWEIVH